ncbi:IMPAD1 family protein [Megaselia abdita]
MIGHSVRVNRGAVLLVGGILLIAIIYLFTNDNEAHQLYGNLRNGRQINLRKLLIGSIKAAKAGGIEVVTVSRNVEQLNQRSKGKTKEGVDDPLTDADSKSHCIMKSGLRRLFPKVEIISEEDKIHGGCQDTSAYFDLDPTVIHENAVIPDEMYNIEDITVWIDPLDATKEYTEKLYEYVTTMVCVAVNGVPVIGVIHSPFSGKTTWAWVNRAMSEDLLLVKKEENVTNNPTITVSRSHSGDVKEKASKAFGSDSNILIAAGSGYKVLQVVSKNATIYLHTTRIKKWDVCAGNAILSALGGRMSTLENDSIDYSSDLSPVNDKGILATLSHHDYYFNKYTA